MKKINEVSQISGVTKWTLQYYDNEGLMRVNRSELNYRIYDEKALKSIWEILIYREVGFELDEIKKLHQMNQRRLEEVLEGKLEKLREEREEMNSKIEFLSRIIKEGIPPIGFEENETKITYVEVIRKYRDSLKQEGGQ